jgi:non-specific serine/threonine protein kinase
VDCYLQLAEAAEPELAGAEQVAWLERLEAEHDNLRSALEYALESKPDHALQLAGALGCFWDTRGHWTEGQEVLTRALQRGAAAPIATQAKALERSGFLMFRQGEFEAAQRPVERSVELNRAIGDQRGLARALSTLGLVVWQQGDYATARGLFDESVQMLRKVPDQRGIAAMLLNPGFLAVAQGEYEAARSILEESLAVAQESGDKRNVAMSLRGLGYIARGQGDQRAARSYWEQCLALAREVGHKIVITDVLNAMAFLALDEGDEEAARSLVEESLAMSREIGPTESMSGSFTLLAKAAEAAGEPERAARLFGAAGSLRGDILLVRAVRADSERSIAAARASLGEEAFAAAWAEGQAMTLEEVVALALEC